MIEHYAGKFPTWLSPVQVKIITVADRHEAYAKQVADVLKSYDIRVALDVRQESVGYKIREARMERNPYMLVIGDKEIEENNIAVRSRDKGDTESLSLETFTDRLIDEIVLKK